MDSVRVMAGVGIATRQATDSAPLVEENLAEGGILPRSLHRLIASGIGPSGPEAGRHPPVMKNRRRRHFRMPMPQVRKNFGKKRLELKGSVFY
jgi:hypothetical protein